MEFIAIRAAIGFGISDSVVDHLINTASTAANTADTAHPSENGIWMSDDIVCLIVLYAVDNSVFGLQPAPQPPSLHSSASTALTAVTAVRSTVNNTTERPYTAAEVEALIRSALSEQEERLTQQMNEPLQTLLKGTNECRPHAFLIFLNVCVVWCGAYVVSVCRAIRILQ